MSYTTIRIESYRKEKEINIDYEKVNPTYLKANRDLRYRIWEELVFLMEKYGLVCKRQKIKFPETILTKIPNKDNSIWVLWSKEVESYIGGYYIPCNEILLNSAYDRKPVDDTYRFHRVSTIIDGKAWVAILLHEYCHAISLLGDCNDFYLMCDAVYRDFGLYNSCSDNKWQARLVHEMELRKL